MTRPRTAAVLTLAGAFLLGGSALVARHGTVPAAERTVFHAVNDLPGWLYRPLWIFQQFGNLAVALLLLLALAVAFRRPGLAAAAVGAVGAKLVLERVVKASVERGRPGSTIGDVVFRGDVPPHGLSFVSGHAVIATAGATMLMAVLPGRWRALPWVIVALDGLARIYVGAHNPLDIVGGAGLGLVIGGPLYLLLAHHDRAQAGAPVAVAA
jgi:membrane-associated phospholipid phosphatase